MTSARLILVVLLLSLPVSTHAQLPRATFLGVLDDHGRLTPIAVYDGSAWRNHWPWGAESDEIRNLPVPESIAAIPADWLPAGLQLPREWRALAGSRRLVPFRALDPERSPETGMMDTMVIRTTYRGPALPASNGGDDTIAISGPGTLRRFLTPSAHEHDAILRQIKSRIAVLEEAAIAQWKKEAITGDSKESADLTRTYMLDDPAAVRYVGTPPPRYQEYSLTKAASTPGTPTAYYLRGEKLFKLHPDRECMLNLTTDGFVIVGPTGDVISEKVGSSASSGYCGDAAEMFFPLATITLGQQTWWIAKNSEEDGYEYALIDPLTGTPVDFRVPIHNRPDL